MDNDKKNVESMGQAVWYNQWIIQKISKYLNGDILEVGFGPGNFTEKFTKFGSVWGFDIDSEYIKDFKKKFKTKVKSGFGDIEKGKYFFKNKKFDTIVCFNVLEHIKNDEKGLGNLNKLLNPGGHLILILPAHMFLYGSIDKNIGHYRRYDYDRIKKLLKKVKLNLLSIRSINLIGAAGWWFEGKILKKQFINPSKVALFDKVAPFIFPVEEILKIPIGTSILLVAKKE